MKDSGIHRSLIVLCSVSITSVLVITLVNILISINIAGRVICDGSCCECLIPAVCELMECDYPLPPDPVEPFDRVAFEEELRRFIFSSPRVVVLQYEPGPAEGQYWHYHRFHVPLGTQYVPQSEWIPCDVHWCDYPTATSMVPHTIVRCEDPDCEIPRFYQPSWRLSDRRNVRVLEPEEEK